MNRKPGTIAEEIANVRVVRGDNAAAKVLLAYARTHEDGVLVTGILFRMIAHSSSADDPMDAFNAAIQRVTRGSSTG